MSAIDKLNEELNRLFDVFNDYYFEGVLDKPIIIAQTNGKDKATMGWCTTRKVWKDSTENQYYYEITICAEYLYRNVTEICATLLHEMAHLYNLQNKIKDTSRANTYHNKKFKVTGEMCGLIIEYDKRIGWSTTKLSDEAKEFVESNVNFDVFTLTRGRHKDFDSPDDNTDAEEGDGEEEKPKHSTIKYICPACGTKIRATKEVNVICGDCQVPFIKREET